jgi:hypothetical protein
VRHSRTYKAILELRGAHAFRSIFIWLVSIDGTTYGYDVVIDRGRIRKRKKKPSKRFRDRARHYVPVTPDSPVFLSKLGKIITMAAH